MKFHINFKLNLKLYVYMNFKFPGVPRTAQVIRSAQEKLKESMWERKRTDGQS